MLLSTITETAPQPQEQSNDTCKATNMLCESNNVQSTIKGKATVIELLDDDDDNNEEEIVEEEIVEEEEYIDSSDDTRSVYRGERAEIAYITKHFPPLAHQYQLIRKIGEGTFSIVFKAKDLLGRSLKDNRWQLPPSAQHYMAIKCIHISSSPSRIHSEINKLAALRHSPSIAPMLDAFRYEDRVAIVLPYIRHDDFKKFYTSCGLDEIRCYMYSLLESLRDTHSQGIIHRDVKPTNFLYDLRQHRGFLVDFGLAQDVDPTKPLYPQTAAPLVSTPMSEDNCVGYLVHDSRPVLRANRAGTRGFRPPEVLLKIEHQTAALDIWAAGVILLSFLTGRYPFFNSNSDAEALVEITCLQGRSAMKAMAAKYHRSFHCNIPTIRNRPVDLSRLIKFLNQERLDLIDLNAVSLLDKLLKVDPVDRITASDALSHPFFN
ncbi:kinase-like domain-containing protein [Syncephalis fuscata]|nr:kinase-like domain-containing protein [Syncephalis fuscata]